MAENFETRRTPEEFNTVTEVIAGMLPHIGTGELYISQDTENLGEPFNTLISNPIFDPTFRSAMIDAVGRARWIGMIEILRYASGEQELPDDVQMAIKIVERMSKVEGDREMAMKMLRSPLTKIGFIGMGA